MIKAVIFDLDGTLVDSAPDIQASVNEMLAEEGVPLLDLPTVISFVGNGLPKLVERVMAARSIPVSEFQRLSTRVLAIYNASSSEKTRPYKGVRPVLESLQQRGLFLGVCTNKPEAPAHHVLEATGLSSFFGQVVGGDSLPTRKPDPQPLFEVMGDFAVDEVLYVGDSEVDAETAERAKVKFALFSEGYRKSPVSQIPHEVVFSDWGTFLQKTDLRAFGAG